MVPWPHVISRKTEFLREGTFRAKEFGAMSVRCGMCRRYAALRVAGLHDLDYGKTFNCSKCGAEAWLCEIKAVSFSLCR